MKERSPATQRYLAWAWHEGKIRTPLTEQSYRKVLEEVEEAIDSPPEQVSADALREYQYSCRNMKANSWNFRCSVIAEFCRYLVSQEGRQDNPSGVLRRLPQELRKKMDPGELEVLISTLDPEYRAVADLLRETGLSLTELQQVNVRSDHVPTKLRVRGARNETKEVEVTPIARDRLRELGGRLPYRKRTYERRFKEAGIMAGDVARLGPSRPLSLDALHPRISLEVRQQLVAGGTELAAFAAFREVEIRVREMAKESPSVLGVDLMQQAFRIGGPLARASDKGEQQAIMALFWGAIGVFKNPSSHRRVQFSDPTFAREVILLADLLHRMLDDIEVQTPP